MVSEGISRVEYLIIIEEMKWFTKCFFSQQTKLKTTTYNIIFKFFQGESLERFEA